MTRKKKLLFLSVMAAWLALRPSEITAFSWQCVTGGAVVQDNFAALFQGWYCSGQGNAQSSCQASSQAAKCQIACDDCDKPYEGTDGCEWWTAAPWPNGSVAQTYGCTQSNPYPNKYRIVCHCPGELECTGCNTQTCCETSCQGTWMDGDCNTGSPILVNLDGNRQLDLTSPTEGVWFDLNMTGQSQRVAWTDGAARIGFLTLDRNGNGLIDDGSELFGTSTPLKAGGTAQNGFVALADLDGELGPSDGRIDASDPAYSALRLWIDSNHNGVSELAELSQLDQSGIVSVSTDYRENHRRDRHGNRFRYVGEAEVMGPNGSVGQHRQVFDVFFRIGSS